MNEEDLDHLRRQVAAYEAATTTLMPFTAEQLAATAWADDFAARPADLVETIGDLLDHIAQLESERDDDQAAYHKLDGLAEQLREQVRRLSGEVIRLKAERGLRS